MSRGTSTLSTSQVSVTTTATLLKAANSNRVRLQLLGANNTVYIGPTSGVTTSTGLPIPYDPNHGYFETDYTGDVYGIVGSGTITVYVAEEAT